MPKLSKDELIILLVSALEMTTLLQVEGCAIKDCIVCSRNKKIINNRTLALKLARKEGFVPLK